MASATLGRAGGGRVRQGGGGRVARPRCAAYTATHHPERLRDGPDDAAATSRPGSSSPVSRCQCPSDEEDSVSFVQGLSCRECARPYPAEALHVCEYCFGPLEV